MNQDISKIIKKIREDNKLTQKEMADELGVTFQAVSKWENGKNIPDIAILTEISKKYNYDINELLGTKSQVKLEKKHILILCSTIMAVCLSLIVAFYYFKDDNFKLKTLSSKCTNFNIYGIIAYNSNKLSMYISEINYCGEEDDNKYKEIKCSLYEKNDNETKLIDECNKRYEEGKTIDTILNEINFNVEDYNKICKSYSEDNIFLEISATNINNEIKTFNIPLGTKDTCNNKEN